MWRDRLVRGRIGESEDRMISMSIPSLEKKHREQWGIRGKAKKTREKRIWRFWRALWQRESERESGENKNERMVEGQGQ